MDNLLKTVHLVGAQKTNYPWGFENRLFPVFEKLGWKVISTDFRQEADILPARLQQPCDLVLFCKAETVPAELIRSVKYPTMLWWAELLGSLNQTDEHSEMMRKSLKHNILAYDHVFLHDEASIPLAKEWGVKSVSFLPTAATNPEVQKKLDVEKKYDVTFVGQITPRREKYLRELKKHIHIHIAKVWEPGELNLLFNQSKIVLNIHLSTLLNTETRIGEVLGSGSFLLSEELSSPNMFQNREHAVFVKPDDIADMIAKIKYYLENDKEREKIAQQGHIYAHQNHTLINRIESIISTRIKKQPYLYWPAVLGILKDEHGNTTNNLLDFYKAVEVEHA